jgi:hypothetical protein
VINANGMTCSTHAKFDYEGHGELIERKEEDK